MYPKRKKQHTDDTRARGIFLSSIPSMWICREVLERDYGIDYYLELVGDDGDLTGHMVAVQLKGTKELKWKGNETNSHALFSGIKSTTISYWMAIQVPVFLCVVEFSSGKVYFAAVKRQVRQRYSRYLKYGTFGFRLFNTLDFSNIFGQNVFVQEYYRERSYDRFIDAATDLVIHNNYYFDLLNRFKAMDDTSPVDVSDQIALGALFTYVEAVLKYTGSRIGMKPLKHFFNIDQKKFKNSDDALHGATAKIIVAGFENEFRSALQNARDIITQQESNYWEKVDSVLYKIFRRV